MNDSRIGATRGLKRGERSPHEEALRMQAAFFKRMGGGEQILQLVEHLPGVSVFVKDCDGRFMYACPKTLERIGLQHAWEVIGKQDADIHPERVAFKIREDDRRVMETREPLVDRVETLYTRCHAKDWYKTTKLPIHDKQGDVIGVMGYVRPYRRSESTHSGTERLDRVVAYIQEHHANPISVEDLARIACISGRHLHRLFHETFGMSTQVFIVRTRVQAASDALLMTEKSLSEIACAHGFCDQSAFSRAFSEHTGETPSRFRQRRLRPAGGEHARSAG